MFRLLRWRLGRTLLRAAGRRCGGCAARLLPERAGDTGPGAEGRPSRGTPARGQGLLPLLAALAWFSRPAAAAEQSGEDETDEVEAEIIQLLKRAKVRGLGRACALSAPLSPSSGWIIGPRCQAGIRPDRSALNPAAKPLRL